MLTDEILIWEFLTVDGFAARALHKKINSPVSNAIGHDPRILSSHHHVGSMKQDKSQK